MYYRLTVFSLLLCAPFSWGREKKERMDSNVKYICTVLYYLRSFLPPSFCIWGFSEFSFEDFLEEMQLYHFKLLKNHISRNCMSLDYMKFDILIK